MPNRLIDYAKGLSLAIGFPLTPYFGAAVGRGNHEELVKSWITTSQTLQIVSLAMPVFIFFCGETFLGLWLGAEYAVAGRVVMYVLLVGLVADSLAINAFRLLTAQGGHGKCAMVWFCLSVLSIPAGMWGANLWGIAGVAAGTTMVTVLGNFVTIFLACSAMRVSMLTFFRKTLLQVMFPLLVLTAVLSFYEHVTLVLNFLDLIFQILLSGSVYLVAVWFFTFDEVVRERLLYQVKLKFKKDR
jgi:O-antigen/teichoic acid export membrane protein